MLLFNEMYILRMLFCFASLYTLEQLEQPSYDEKSHYDKKDRSVFLACADFNAPGIRVPFLCTNVLRMLFCVESPDALEQGEKPSDDDKSH